MVAATMESPHLTKTSRKPSMRQQLKEMVKGSTWTGLMKHSNSSVHTTRRFSVTPSQAPKTVDVEPGYDFLGNGLPTQKEPARRRPRKRQERQKVVHEEKQRNSLYSLKFENPSLDDLRMSFEKGDDRWSVANPLMMERELEKELAVGRGPAEKEVVDIDQLPGHIKTHIGSDSSIAPSRVDSTRPEKDRVPELRKLPRKFEVKMDTLARPVSRATANPEVTKVSKTIESINKKQYSGVPAKKKAGQLGASNPQAVNHPAHDGLEKFPELHADPIPPSAVVPNNTKALRTLGISEAESKEQSGLPPVSSIQTFPMKSNTPIANSMGSPSTFSFTINENLRRIAPGATTSPTSNRHSVGDMNKLLEQNREANMSTKEKPQPPALTIRRSFSVGAKSPTKSETAPNTPTYRPRRPSGKATADRLAWIRELEEGGNGKGANSGRAAMYKNLQGGVADKLARFESSNKALTGGSGPRLVRTNSVSSRMSASSEAYGIENGAAGSRLSRASTMDEEFRKKMEEVAEKAKKKVEKDGDQEALIMQVNRDAEMALKEEKRRSLKMNSGTFNYAFNDKAGRKTDLAPDATKAPVVRVKDPAAVAASANPAVDLGSFTPTKQGATKMPQFKVKDLDAVAGSANPPIDLTKSKQAERISPPQFRLKDPNAVAASANPPIKLDEKKISAPTFRVKDPNAVAASANPPVSMVDGDEYDPFNPTKYPVASSIPAIKRLSSSKTKEELLAMEPADLEIAEEAKSAPVPEPATIAAPQVVEEKEAEAIAEPEVVSQEAEDTKATPQSTPIQAEHKKATSPSTPPAQTEQANAAQSADKTQESKPAQSQTPATVPTIKEIPPTPPKKEVPSTPIPKYVALRERAQKAAEMPAKVEPAKATPAPVPASQTFSRLFGAPMASGRAPVAVPSPAPVAKVEESKKFENVGKEEEVKKEMPVAKGKAVEKQVSTQEMAPAQDNAEAQKEASISREIPAQKDALAQKQIPIPIVASIQNNAALPTEKTTPTTPTKPSAPAPTSTKSSPVAALVTSAREEEAPATPKMGGSSVGTTSGSNSPTTPTFTAARLPAFADKE